MSDPQSNDPKPSGKTDGGEIESAIRKLSESKPQVVTEFMAMMGMGPMGNPLHQKMDGSHITQVLDLAAKHDEREYDLQLRTQAGDSQAHSSSRRYVFWSFVLVVALIVTVLILFREKPEVLVPILSGIGGLLGGFLGGYGLGKQQGK